MLTALCIVFGFFIFLALSNLIIQFLKNFGGLIIQLSKTKPVNLRKKFGEWAVVTGSTDGVGKEYAKELAKRNINIVLISRNLEKLNNTNEEIKRVNSAIEVKIIQADFTKGIDEFKKIKTQLYDVQVGILVNNVGIINEYPMYLDESSEEELLDLINVNIGATVLMTRMVIEKMKKQGKGAIVNMSSGSALMPLPLMSVYSASKMFVTHFSEAIRAEYSKYGVTVQCLSPFYIKTKMVGYSQRISTSTMCPGPDTYAKNAIDTLGKIDSTTGYWIHEIQTFFTLLAPKWVRIKIGFLINQAGRNEYFAEKNKFEKLRDPASPEIK